MANNIKQILAHPIVGNAYSDRALLNAIHAFVMDTRNSNADCLAALRKLDEVMDLETPAATGEDTVQQYRDSLSEVQS